MTKRPIIVLLLTTALLVMLAYLGLLSDTDARELQGWQRWLRNNIHYWIFGITAATIILQAVDKVVLVHQARKETVQRILDEVVKDMLGNDPRTNRCTLFVAVWGARAAAHLMWRFWFQDEKWPVFKQIVRALFSPTQLYLYAYVRASRSNSDRSCVLWPVYNSRLDKCEGVAGSVWADGYHARSVSARPGKVSRSVLMGANRIEAISATHPLRKYAVETNIRDVRLLRQRNTLANHFAGECVHTRKGHRWGVLLVDSTADVCPFPGGGNDPQFRRRLGTYAQILSTLLT